MTIERERAIAIQSAMSAQQEEISQLRAEIAFYADGSHIQRHLEHFEEHFTSTFSDHFDHLTDLEAAIESVSDKLAALKSGQPLEARIEDIRSQFLTELESQQHANGDLANELRAARREAALLQDENSSLKREIGGLRGQGESSARLQELEGILAEREEEIAMLKQQRHASSNLRSLSDQVDKISSSNQSLQAERAGNLQEISNLSSALRSAEESERTLRARVAALESKLATFSQDPSRSTEITLHDRIAELSQSLDQSQTAHERQLALLDDQISATMAHSEALKEQLTEAHSQNVEYDRRLRQITGEFTSLQGQVAGLEARLAEADAELGHQREIVELLRLKKGKLRRN
jgi:chromosome segregation ATPase